MKSYCKICGDSLTDSHNSKLYNTCVKHISKYYYMKINGTLKVNKNEFESQQSGVWDDIDVPI